MSGLTDMSSPADSGLMDLKRKRQQKKKNKKKPKEEDDIVLDDCELGKSPELNFTKKFNRDE